MDGTDQLLDLKPYMDKDASIDAADFDQGMLDYFRKNGGIYGLPYDRSAYAVFFNKDLFDKAHVPYPKAGWTYSDFTTAAAAITKLSDGSTKYFGLSQPPGLLRTLGLGRHLSWLRRGADWR